MSDDAQVDAMFEAEDLYSLAHMARDRGVEIQRLRTELAMATKTDHQMRVLTAAELMELL